MQSLLKAKEIRELGKKQFLSFYFILKRDYQISKWKMKKF
jgi:hypothetical protein